MSTETGIPDISFSGSAPAQEAAQRMFAVMRARGMFMSDDAPIRVAKSDLVAFMEGTDGVSAAVVEEALSGNPGVFGIETAAEGVEIVTTTRLGRVPGPVDAQDQHTLAQRLMTPEPKPEKPAMPVRERVRVDPSWATFSVAGLEDEEELAAIEAEQEAFSLSEVLEEETVAEAPVADVIPEVTPEVTPEPVVADAAVVEAEAAPEEPVEVAPEPVAEAPAPVVETPVEVEAEPAAVEAAPIEAEPVVAEVTEPEIVEAPVVEAPRATPVPVGNLTDVSGYDDEEVAEALVAALDHLPHVAHFGDQWGNEDRVHRLSRGELRRIKDYIEEQEQPLTDETLVQDILGVRPNNPDYQSTLFALNFRLSRERDFEFVGTNDQRFWATTNLPAIGTLLRKPNDIGTDYRFLADAGTHETAEHRSVTSVDHVVTFYEYVHGLLPYDEELQRLVPAPMLAEQRSAVFTFEIPQTYTTYLVELRYPTPNRGGFFLGLDDFYLESIVPGAVITISATENDGHYKVEFLNVGQQSDRLLELDAKRSPRYHFRPTTYACAVDDAWLLNEDRFPSLGSEKPLVDKVRRRNDAVVEATFERIGMDDGNGGLLASFEDLLAAVNIERPFSAELLHEVLGTMDDVRGSDADGYTYAKAS